MNVTAEIDDAQSNLIKSIDRLLIASPEAAEAISKNLSIMFIQSVTKATPPGKSAKIAASKYKRDIVRLTYRDGTPIKRKKMDKYAVFKKVMGRDKYIRLDFKTKPEAKRHIKIKSRGAMRAGWFFGMQKVGGKYTAAMMTMMTRAPRLKDTMNTTTKQIGKAGAEFTITNNVDYAHRYGDVAKLVAMRKVNQRILSQARVLERKAVKAWL